MSKIKLFNQKENCCGCSACMNICPKQAITMVEDECGFLYPAINDDLCIECGACEKVCSYQKGTSLKLPIKTFAGVNNKKSQLVNSASGGIFAALADNILQQGGVVFGVTLDFINGKAKPHHIAIDNIADLHKLQGSKYVQSNIGDTYKKVEVCLKQNQLVLFSGTPCQVGGLNGYLKKDYENLITIDIICHGVPNARFFNDYIQMEKDKRKADEIIGYVFRDKRKGWGYHCRIDIKTKKGNKKSLSIPGRLNSYITLFLDRYTFRESCYSCNYACPSRPGDLTIGDYWGIEKVHPELLEKHIYQEQEGISCILVNTKKGLKLCKEVDEFIRMEPSNFEKVKAGNDQLERPSRKAKGRDNALEIYRQNGYVGVENYFQSKFKKKIIIYTIYYAIPRTIRLKLKQVWKG